MAGQLTDAQVTKMKEQFAALSQDGSGKVTADQMIQVYGALGIALSEEQKQEIRKTVLLVDPSGGPISADDYLARMQMTDSAMAAFKMFDKDNSGFIDKEEIVQGMAQLGMQVTEEEAEEMLQEADTDGDGRINYEEFAKTFQ